eukprot:scpid45603/ scgid7951/ 
MPPAASGNSGGTCSSQGPLSRDHRNTSSNQSPHHAPRSESRKQRTATALSRSAHSGDLRAGDEHLSGPPPFGNWPIPLLPHMLPPPLPLPPSLPLPPGMLPPLPRPLPPASLQPFQSIQSRPPSTRPATFQFRFDGDGVYEKPVPPSQTRYYDIYTGKKKAEAMDHAATGSNKPEIMEETASNSHRDQTDDLPTRDVSTKKTKAGINGTDKDESAPSAQQGTEGDLFANQDPPDDESSGVQQGCSSSDDRSLQGQILRLEASIKEAQESLAALKRAHSLVSAGQSSKTTPESKCEKYGAAKLPKRSMQRLSSKSTFHVDLPGWVSHSPQQQFQSAIHMQGPLDAAPNTAKKPVFTQRRKIGLPEAVLRQSHEEHCLDHAQPNKGWQTRISSLDEDPCRIDQARQYSCDEASPRAGLRIRIRNLNSPGNIQCSLDGAQTDHRAQISQDDMMQLRAQHAVPQDGRKSSTVTAEPNAAKPMEEYADSVLKKPVGQSTVPLPPLAVKTAKKKNKKKTGKPSRGKQWHGMAAACQYAQAAGSPAASNSDNDCCIVRVMNAM